MTRSRLVYSTDSGRVPVTGRPESRPASTPPRAPDDGVVRVSRERGGRNGKTVTLVRGLPDRGDALEARAAALTRLCGAGGTLRDGTVEIQGDHRERIALHLRGLGLRVKLAGG